MAKDPGRVLIFDTTLRDGEQSQEILKIILVILRVMVIDQFILQSLEEMEKELKFKLELKK